eukprot:m.830101 g.830101  ORF g.830101 m.830101 type:complete len:52 (-) comp23425_c0_seq13:1298-1453(-)
MKHWPTSTGAYHNSGVTTGLCFLHYTTAGATMEQNETVGLLTGRANPTAQP